MARGFYSIVQYCPDRFRAEAVNVGLVLFCLDPKRSQVQMSHRIRRVQKLFSKSSISKSDLIFSMTGLEARIKSLLVDVSGEEQLAQFAASRANDLRLTEPRLAKIEDFDRDFARLFSELVDDHSAAALADQSPAEVLPPALNEVFYRLQQEKRIWQPGTISVPIYKRKLDIPYAYRNGVLNLIKPHVFPANKRAETQAAELAINGDLIQRHPLDEKKKLIVISTQETPRQSEEIDEHVEPLFREYNVTLIRPSQAQAFAKLVDETAH